MKISEISNIKNLSKYTLKKQLNENNTKKEKNSKTDFTVSLEAEIKKQKK